jgi:hypothetical protein
MKFFVEPGSVVRRIWGRSDTILFIFGGASAEFALNKAVDWLYFTGRLPADPLKRLFSTVTYARLIVFSEMEAAHHVIDKISSIHRAVENDRKASIPEWAYRDVLVMLVHYSIASFELLERKLSQSEYDEVYEVFYRLGIRMGLKDLPLNYTEWLSSRKKHLQQDLQKSNYTIDLYQQYKKHLGPTRFKLLWEAQKLVVPDRVNTLLELGKNSLLHPLMPFYKFSRRVKLDWFLIAAFLPSNYRGAIKALNTNNHH